MNDYTIKCLQARRKSYGNPIEITPSQAADRRRALWDGYRDPGRRSSVGRYYGNRKLSGCSGRADPQIGKRSDSCQSNQGKTQGGRRPAAFLQRKRFYASVSFARGMRAGAPCGILSGGPSSRQAAVSAARRADPARLPDFRARKRAALCRRCLVWRRF